MRTGLDTKHTILLVSSIISTIVYFYIIIRGKKDRIFYYYVHLIGVCLLWVYGYIFEWMAMVEGNPSRAWIFALCQYFGIIQAGVVCLSLCLALTANTLHLRRLYKLSGILFFAALFALVLTNDYHHLIYTTYSSRSVTYGPGFYFIMFLTASCIVAGIILLVQYIKTHKGYLNKQLRYLAVFLVFGLTVMITESAVIYFFNIKRSLYFYTVAAISFNILFFCYCVFKYHFFNVTSIALGNIVNQMPGALIVLDRNNRISSWNRSFEKLLDNNEALKINNSFEPIIDHIKERTLHSQSPPDLLDQIKAGEMSLIEGELRLKKNNINYYKTILKSLCIKKKLIGKVITFTDITFYKNTAAAYREKTEEIKKKNEQITALNSLLKEKNEQIKKEVRITGELEAARERNRVAQEVHDILGQTLSLILVTLEVGKAHYPSQLELADTQIKEAIRLADKGLDEIAGTLFNVEKNEKKVLTLKDVLEKMKTDFREIGITVNSILKEVPDNLTTVYIDFIYKLCRESTSNAVRHGAATTIDITIFLHDNRIKVTIADNGSGCDFVKPGFGITTIQQRVEKLKGNIELKSTGGNGVIVFVDLPFDPAEGLYNEEKENA